MGLGGGTGGFAGFVSASGPFGHFRRRFALEAGPLRIVPDPASDEYVGEDPS